MYVEEGQLDNTQTKGIQTFARRLRFGPLRKDILNGSGSSEDLKEDWEGGGSGCGCGEEKVGGCGGSAEKRSRGKRSIIEERME